MSFTKRESAYHYKKNWQKNIKAFYIHPKPELNNLSLFVPNTGECFDGSKSSKYLLDEFPMWQEVGVYDKVKGEWKLYDNSNPANDQANPS